MDDWTTPTFAVISGGGTSGHVVPALAIAELLIESGHAPSSLHFVGSDRGVEVQLLAHWQYRHTLLRVAGLQRNLHLRSLARSLVRSAAVIPMMWRAVRAARELLKSLQPKVVVSVGGYASIPATRAAHQLGIPVVTCSYDRRPGLATRLQSRYAVTSAVAYMPSQLRNAQLTGAPVRAELRHLNRTTARHNARLRLNISQDRQLLVVMGGSLGSAVLNSTLRGVVESWSNRGDIAVLHLSGVRYLLNEIPNLVQNTNHATDRIEYRRIAYCENMADVYAAADLIVSRSGASSVAEIATVGVPSILIPWKDAAENHQQANAEWLVEHGGALLLDEVDLTVESLGAIITDLLEDPSRLAQLGLYAYELGALHRECRIAVVIEDAARGKVQGHSQQ